MLSKQVHVNVPLPRDHILNIRQCIFMMLYEGEVSRIEPFQPFLEEAYPKKLISPSITVVVSTLVLGFLTVIV